MTRDQRDLDELVKRLLADPANSDHPMHYALSQLWLAHRELLNRIER
ncbi:MAG: GGDEF domain-containing protein, partial [Chitinimonas sp.]|nr:GGDEF domain-containing protein [Chitinimonas sp.]